jgi:hypothetical protein
VTAAILHAAAIVLLGSAAPDASPLPAKKSESIRGEVLGSIPFHIDRKRVILPVRIGGARSLDVIFDTGTTLQGVYLFHSEVVDELHLDEFVEVRVPGAGSGEPSHAIMADSLSLFCGEVEFRQQMAVVSRSDVTQRFPTVQTGSSRRRQAFPSATSGRGSADTSTERSGAWLI